MDIDGNRDSMTGSISSGMVVAILAVLTSENFTETMSELLEFVDENFSSKPILKKNHLSLTREFLFEVKVLIIFKTYVKLKNKNRII